MRICIPTETDDGLIGRIYGHFGSAPYFTIYDSEIDSLKIVPNRGAGHNPGTCNPIVGLEQENIGVVLCPGMGRRALQRLLASGIKVYRVQPGTVRDALFLYQKEAAEELSLEEACDGEHHC